MQTSGAHREARIVEADKCSDRYFRCGRYPWAGGAARQHFDFRRQRGADTSSAVGVAQPANSQVRERYELRQAISAVAESLRLDAQIERPEGQTQLTRAKVNFLSVFGRKSERDASIVKVNRQRQSRVIQPGRVGRIRRKQESVRVG